MSITTEKQIQPITLESVREIRDKLKDLDKKWVQKVAARMLAADPDNTYTEEHLNQVAAKKVTDERAREELGAAMVQVRNITNNVVRHNGKRRAFILAAGGILDGLLTEHDKAVGMATKHGGQ